MTIETTSTLSNSVRARYIEDYLDAAEAEKLYDQFAMPVGQNMEQLKRGSSVNIPFLADMEPGTAAIPEDTDISPQTLKDALATITPTSRGEALQSSEKLLIQAYTDYGQKMSKRVGKNMMESIDLLAQAAATQGSLVERTVARAALDAGEATHRASDAQMSEVQSQLLSMKVPGFKFDGGEVWPAIMHPYVFHDIREGGNVDSIGLYQDKGIHLNFELGQVGPFRLVVSPWAKVFLAAGVVNGTPVDTTLDGAVEALALEIEVAADTNIAAGQWLAIGTEETANTHHPKNERVKVASISGTTVTIVGSGANGGLRFDHATGVAVSNADSAFTIVYGGPSSLAKLYATEIGEYGQVVGPKRTGNLDQFITLGWKFYGGYGRIAENRLVRGEYSVSYDA